MNVFVLCTGRCGSMTFARACGHIENYTVAHESPPIREHLDYPDRHIEVNNRLVWFLPLLAEKYPHAYYVHLFRDPRATAESFARRGKTPISILHAWQRAVKMGSQLPAGEAARQYVSCASGLIEMFLAGVPAGRRCRVDIERPEPAFGDFWSAIAAKGDQAAACRELAVRHNAGTAAGNCG